MFIVLEGVDGSGKSTQIAKLREMFAQKGIESEYLHFPRFDAPYFGDMIARFLRGELGSIEQVDPYVVALLYAGDRKDAATMIRQWLAEGKVVICDRYVYSNIASLITTCIKEKMQGKNTEDWNKVVLIPVKTEIDSQKSIIGIKSNLDMESASLKGGEKDLIKMQVLYTTF